MRCNASSVTYTAMSNASVLLMTVAPWRDYGNKLRQCRNIVCVPEARLTSWPLSSPEARSEPVHLAVRRQRI